MYIQAIKREVSSHVTADSTVFIIISADDNINQLM